MGDDGIRMNYLYTLLLVPLRSVRLSQPVSQLFIIILLLFFILFLFLVKYFPR